MLSGCGSSALEHQRIVLDEYSRNSPGQYVVVRYLHDLARLFADTKLSAEERAVGQKCFATHYKDMLAAADELYLKGGESLLRDLALFDLEWGNIQAGHAWVKAQTDDADADVARLGMTYLMPVRTCLICGSTHASGFAGWKSP